MKLENLIGFSESILESPKIVIFNLTFRVSKIGFFYVFQPFLGLEYMNLCIFSFFISKRKFLQSNPQEDLVSNLVECNFTLSSLLEDTAGYSLETIYSS